MSEPLGFEELDDIALAVEGGQASATSEISQYDEVVLAALVELQYFFDLWNDAVQLQGTAGQWIRAAQCAPRASEHEALAWRQSQK